MSTYLFSLIRAIPLIAVATMASDWKTDEIVGFADVSAQRLHSTTRGSTCFSSSCIRTKIGARSAPDLRPSFNFVIDSVVIAMPFWAFKNTSHA